MSGDGELEAEQAYVDYAYERLGAMRARAEQLLATSGAGTDEVTAKDLQRALARRVALLTDSGRPLCFGRIDETGGDTWYIGRRHVEDERADPVVVEWRTPVAEPFYRAHPGDPFGLARRRQFLVDDRQVVSMADDVFDGATPEQAEGPRIRGRDTLLAELERSRTGEMLDIVATIQVEQDEVIRSPQAGAMAVQGGPGTGKTAVGLHRAAFLLYGNDALARAGMLVIGPNRLFLRYIAQVLPSLGEEAVLQTTLSDLVPDVQVRGEDGPVAQRVKGDARMATVLGNALAELKRPIDDDITLRYGRISLTLDADDINALAASVSERRMPYAAARTSLREQLVRLLYDRYSRGIGQLRSDDYATVARNLRQDAAFGAALDRLWPSVSPAALVRDVLTSPSRLARAAAGVLSEDEQSAILRSAAARIGREAWTDADMALIDEAHDRIAGQSRTYGHVVVDEAQDLSPMQLRMLARRCPAGSFTILGDIAQGIGVWAHDDWKEVLDHLPTPNGSRVEELRLGYRAPAQVLELASRLLPVAAPQVPPTESVRTGKSGPRVVRVAMADLAERAAAEAVSLRTEHGSVGVLLPLGLVDACQAALDRRGVDYIGAGAEGLDRPVAVLPAAACKGLEFDAVVVVEPAAIVDDAPRGLRLLYVAMTRPTRHLTVLHAADLPEPLLQSA